MMNRSQSNRGTRGIILPREDDAYIIEGFP
jgi:hypothetical protein